MKRVIIEGLIVTNVEAVEDDESEGLLVPDGCWVGPGAIWNESAEEPEFSPSAQFL